MANFRNTIAEDVPLSSHTTLRLGGVARYFSTCHSQEELIAHLQWAAVRDIPVQIIGRGSNIVVADAGYDGLVLSIRMGGLYFEDQNDWCDVRAGAGEDWDGLVARCVARGLGGLECLSGIPGLVGATPIQNVGAYGQEVKDSIVSVRALDRKTLSVVEFDNAACKFSYRQSRFKRVDRERYIIVQVHYRLRRCAYPDLRYAELRQYVEQSKALADTPTGQPALEMARKAVLALRRSKAMLIDSEDPNARSVGSFFMNPVVDATGYAEIQQRWRDSGGTAEVPCYQDAGGLKVPAAWLVERAGFPPGCRKGGVAVSERHALALVNRGGTAKELLQLAEEIRRGVKRRFNVDLDQEPVLIGNFS